MTETIKTFMEADNSKIEEIISEYPRQVPVKVAAELLGCSQESMREFLLGSFVGMSWRKAGSVNHAYCIPTAQFVRWYMLIRTEV